MKRVNLSPSFRQELRILAVGIIVSCVSCVQSQLIGSMASGKVVLGPVYGGTVTAYQMLPTGLLDTSNPIATAVTDINGNYVFGSYAFTPAPNTVVCVQVSGGKYTEEGSGAQIALGTNVFNACLPSVSNNLSLGVTIGPLTHIAFLRLQSQVVAGLPSGTSMVQAATNANYAVSQAFGLSDILSIPPDNPYKTISSTASGQYAMILTAISKAAANSSTDSVAYTSSLASKFATTGSFSTASVSTTDATGASVTVTPLSLASLNEVAINIASGVFSVIGVSPPTSYIPLVVNSTPPGTAPSTYMAGITNSCLPTIAVNPTYSGNGNTGGSVPVDPNTYLPGSAVKVLGAGALVKTGYVFAGWNTAANGTGTNYSVGSIFTVGTQNVTLYAIWGSMIFITSGSYSGDLKDGGGSSIVTHASTGISGADAICQYEVYNNSSGIPTGASFKALLVSSTRYPCNSSGVCGSAGWSDWVVRPNTTYFVPNSTYTFISDSNGIFENSFPSGSLLTPQGDSNSSYFWLGILGAKIGSTLGPNGPVVGWSYADNASSWPGDWRYYGNSNCSDWTSTSGNVDAMGDNGHQPDSYYTTYGLTPGNGYSPIAAGDDCSSFGNSRWMATQRLSLACSQAQHLVCIGQ